MPENTDRTLDADLGEQDAPDPGDPADVTEAPTDWDPDTDDETEGVMLICKHCGREISDSIPAAHLAGGHAGKARCNPEDSGLIYGYNAEPTGAKCAYPCLGFKGTDDA